MRALALALVFALAGASALAQTVVAPADARKHLGETVTVEGTVSEIYTAPRSGVTFINMGGLHPNEAFTGVIFKDDADKFPNVASLSGKIVDIAGRVQDYKGRTEIILNDAAQLKTK